MSDIKDWSNTAASNNATPPDGFPEGMNPSDVNNAAREVMAAVRRQHEDAAWVDLGDTPTQASATTFTITGDVTAAYAAGRRIRCTDATTLYGEITSSSFSSPDTTVTVALDSGSLSVSLSAVALSVITPEANGGTTSGDFTVGGAFTSLGIDDNATGERVQITDTKMQMGDGASAETYEISIKTVTDGELYLSGGNAVGDGGNILLYGSTNAVRPGDWYLRSGINNVAVWDESAGTLTISTGSGAKSTALAIGSEQIATFESTVVAGAGVSTGTAQLSIGDATLTTGTAAIEIGPFRSGDGASLIDFHADSVTYTDYALRIIRNSGANGGGAIQHRGTGQFEIETVEAAAMVLKTSATTALSIDTSQNVDVVGDITAATVNADGDTSAGDNAAMGYTATEGLILTGQGSTNDITLKNDADASVLTVPTGTTTVEIPGTLAVEAYSEDSAQYTATTGTRDLDVSLATYFYPSADLGTASITFTFSNPAASGRVSSFTLELLGADGATLTWPASVAWANGDTEPAWSAGTDIVSFITRDGGTTWRGFLGGLNF